MAILILTNRITNSHRITTSALHRDAKMREVALLIGTAVTDHRAKKGQPGAPASHGWRSKSGRLTFVYRAAFVGLAAFAAALVGFGLQELLPAAYLATSKSMIGSIVGLIASLLSCLGSWCGRATVSLSASRRSLYLKRSGAVGKR